MSNDWPPAYSPLYAAFIGPHPVGCSWFVRVASCSCGAALVYYYKVYEGGWLFWNPSHPGPASVRIKS